MIFHESKEIIDDAIRKLLNKCSMLGYSRSDLNVNSVIGNPIVLKMSKNLTSGMYSI